MIAHPLAGWLGLIFMVARQGEKMEKRHARPPEGLTQLQNSIPFSASYWPKQITNWPRFKGWGSSFHLLMAEVAKSHCKEAKIGAEAENGAMFAMNV